MKKPRWLLAPAAGLALVLAIACGGDKSASGGGTISNERIDLQSVAYKIETLQSFRFDFRMKLDVELPDSSGEGDDPMGDAFAAALLGLLGDIKAEGAFVGPDSVQTKMTVAGQQIETIQIGDRAWIKEDGEWRETEADVDMFSQSPTDLLGTFLPEEVLQGAKVSKETVNGVKATRYSFDKESLTALAQSLGESTAEFDELKKADLDLWLSEDGGIPVKMVLAMAGESDGQPLAIEMEMNIRDINSKSIKIEAPA